MSVRGMYDFLDEEEVPNISEAILGGLKRADRDLFRALSASHDDLMNQVDAVSRLSYEAVDYVTNDGLCEFLADIAEHAEKIRAPDGALTYLYEQGSDKPSGLHSETGDDKVAFGPQPVLFMAETVLAEKLFGVKPSVPDTFVSRSVCNYAEKFLMMPGNRFETYGYYTRNRTSKTPFLDIPVARLILPVAKQKGTHSDSIEGKAQLMARTQAYCQEDPLGRWTAECASIIQDACLGIMTYGKFPYLPNALGGLDKPVPFRNEQNFARAVHSYKRGRYRNLILTIVQRSHWMMHPEEAQGFARDPFLEEVKHLYQGWQPWYVNYLRHTPTFSGSIPPALLSYSVSHYGLDYMTDLAMRRLHAEGRLVTENQLLIASETQSQFKALLSADSVSEYRAQKESLEKRFRKETVFSRAFTSLWQREVEADVISAVTPEALSMVVNWNLRSTNDVRNYLRGTEMFFHEALDEIYLKGPLKVNFPLIAGGFIAQRRGKAPRSQRTDPDELEKLEAWVRGDRSLVLPPPELLEDDPIILEQISRSLSSILGQPLPAVLLITGDRELCRLINRRFDIVVFRLPPSLIEYRETRGSTRRGAIEGFQTQLRAEFSFIDTSLRTIEDTGAVAAEAAMHASAYYTTLYNENRSSLYTQQFSLREPYVESISRQLANWPTGYDFIFDETHLINRRRTVRKPSVRDSLARARRGLTGSLGSSSAAGLLRRLSSSQPRLEGKPP